ncbi:phosphodiester glycosidase family protein [Devosia sp. LjRoot16]|uniref:phosphodiester glycosidase family protein n=1 Tax=Devosia sp. LjRoot16 TaxID=3342271 RepID=UPI003F4FD5A2
MTPRDSLSLAAFALASLLGAPLAHAAPGEARCAATEFEGARYTVCRAAPAELELHWRDADKRPYRRFDALATALAASGRTLQFAVNAGMYDTEFRPIGLYVEAEEKLVKLNTNEAAPGTKPIPNFYKKPNGVFFIVGDTAAITSTEDYLAAAPEPRLATQSGPMLVIEGQLHPALIPGSTDRTRRSGVGVCREGEVIVAVSDGGVNFHDFARLFRDSLGCDDALFLDGGRGVGLYDPELGRNDVSWHGGYGPMLGVAK